MHKQTNKSIVEEAKPVEKGFLVLVSGAKADESSSHGAKDLLSGEEDALWRGDELFPFHGFEHLFGQRFRVHSCVEIESLDLRDGIFHGTFLVERIAHAHFLKRLDEKVPFKVAMAAVPCHLNFVILEEPASWVGHPLHLVFVDLLFESSHNLQEELLFFFE